MQFLIVCNKLIVISFISFEGIDKNTILSHIGIYLYIFLNIMFILW